MNAQQQKRSRQIFQVFGISLLMAFGWVGGHPRTAVAADTAKERVGIYDSRAVAVAFAGSPAHEKQLSQLRAEHKKAKEAGDKEAVARLEAEGKARQKKAHQQAFSTAPVEEILAHISNALPQIQRESGVTAIVSKWDEATLKKYPGAEKVDVTMKLVGAFQPNERQRKSAIEIQKHKPISLEKAGNIMD